jgi:hypothetical protein
LNIILIDHPSSTPCTMNSTWKLARNHQKWSVQASIPFPRLLESNAMNYLQQITSWHVYELLYCELLQTCWKDDVRLRNYMTCELCTFKLTKYRREDLHVAWIFSIVSHGNAKCSTVIELVNHTFTNSPKGIPPTLNCNISNIVIFQRCHILIFKTQCLTSVLELRYNQLLSMFIKWPNLMKEASLLPINHPHKWDFQTQKEF